MIFNCACGERCDGITAFADHYYKFKNDGRKHYWKTKEGFDTNAPLVQDEPKKKYKIIYKERR
jgi:hypothetical protein